VAGKNTTERRRIVTGSKENTLIEIKKGLLASDNVLVPEGSSR